MTEKMTTWLERCREQREDTAARILAAAVDHAAEHGLDAVTRSWVAARAGVGAGTINQRFGTMEGLRDAIIERAIETERLQLIAQGIAAKVPAALNADPSLKARALASLV